jgi:LacI family transcriptional regulator
MVTRMKDIASDLGVSAVTVSKVLRNHGDIGGETRERVLKRMEELNYQPNLAARTLSTGRSYMMGLVVPNLVHPFFSQIAEALSGVLRQKRYGLLISSSEEDPELEKQEILQLLSRRVDALIIASTQTSLESFRRIEEQKTPYVLIDRVLPGLTANFVGIDNVAAGVMATTHLIEQGCRRIAHIRGRNVSTAIGRLEGYQQALANAKSGPMAERVIPIGALGADRGQPDGYDVTKKLLAGEERPDGIFCYNDPVAMGSMRAILEAGLKIPEDIAVVGCGNLFYADLLRVPLTSIDHGTSGIGTNAANMALARLEARKAPRSESIVAMPKLVVRASSVRTAAEPRRGKTRGE